MRGRSALIACTLLFPAILAWAQQQPSTLPSVDDLVRAGLSNIKDLAAVRQSNLKGQGSHDRLGYHHRPCWI